MHLVTRSAPVADEPRSGHEALATDKRIGTNLFPVAVRRHQRGEAGLKLPREPAMGTMNTLFLKEIEQKTRRGQRGQVEAGKIPGGNSYGYRLVRRLADDASVTTGEREIEEVEARILRCIFAEHASGLAPRRVAAGSAGRASPGHAAPRGTPKSSMAAGSGRTVPCTMRSLERITYNRQPFVKDPATGRRVSRPNPESMWINRERARRGRARTQSGTFATASRRRRGCAG